MNHLIRVALIGLITCVPVSNAMAWNQTQTCDDIEIACKGATPLPVYWKTPCVAFHLNEMGSNQMAFDDIRDVIIRTIQTWNHPDLSSLQLFYAGLTDEDRVGFNPYIDQNPNIIVFRDEVWNESKAIMALTSVTYHSATGLIYDADIEVNTATYPFGIVEKNGYNVVDLENTLTHEIGHTFGLAHSDVPNATMSVYADRGEIELRTLEQDDLDAIAAIYPPRDLKCKFENAYFSKPDLGMNEKPAVSESACSTTPSRPTAPQSWWIGCVFLGACLLGLRPIRHRL